MRQILELRTNPLGRSPRAYARSAQNSKLNGVFPLSTL
jgi:hypothetical protein